MKQPHWHPRHCSRGFTLVESILVLVLLGIAAVGIMSIQGHIFKDQSEVKNLQVGSRLMLECAEQVLAVRRFTQDGYAETDTAKFGANLCNGVPALTGYTIPSVSFTDPYTGGACPAGLTCKLASISESGMTPLTILLVDY